MSFRRHHNCRESGVQWLGRIPAGWEIKKLHYLLSEPPRYGVLVPDYDPDGVPMLRINDMSAGSVDVSSLVTISRELSSQYERTILQTGDLALSVVGTIGQAIIADERLAGINLSRAVARLRFGSTCCKEFARWFFQSTAFRTYVDLTCVGTAQRVLNMDDVSALRIALPALEEQIAISRFLYRETAKIDALVEEQRRLVELLKEKRQAVIAHAVTKGLDRSAPMKESGVEWLGVVPEHWEVTRLANVFREIAEPLVDDLPILSVSIHHGVSDDELDEDELERKVTRSDDRSKYKRVRPNDLVYNMMRAWQGGFGTVLVEGGVSPAYVVARPKGRIETSFVEWVLRTPQCIEEMRTRSVGVTDFRLRLYWDEFKDLRVAVPPLAEQRQILEEVGAQLDRYQALSEVAAEASRLLRERRAALISAAVTGKIDVRESEAAAAELELA